MRRKYELLERETNGLCRIRALRDIPEIGVEAGDVGGYVESEANLAQEGNCWVAGNAKAFQKSTVINDAVLQDEAWALGKVVVSHDAKIRGCVHAYGEAWIARGADIQSDQDYFYIFRIESYFDQATFYRSENGISMVCSCFTGTLEEFREKVRKIHGDTKYAREYELACQLAELHILGQEASE